MDDEIDRFEVREDGIEVAEVDLNEGECTLMVGEELTPAARQIVENGNASPRAMMRSTRWEPMKPAPPVTRTCCDTCAP